MKFQARPIAFASSGTAVLALMFGLLVPLHSARSASCTIPDIRTTIELTEKFGRQRLSNGFSGAQLEHKRRQAGYPASPGANWHPVGLMGRDLSWEIRVEVEGRKLNRGMCVGLKHAELIIGYDNINVYVDRRYRPGSCEYAVILEHEQQHVQNFKNALERFIPDIRQRLEEETRRIRPRVSRSTRRGGKYFVNEIKKRITPMIRRMVAEMDVTDRLIDTPESYRSIQARCDNW